MFFGMLLVEATAVDACGCVDPSGPLLLLVFQCCFWKRVWWLLHLYRGTTVPQHSPCAILELVPLSHLWIVVMGWVGCVLYGELICIVGCKLCELLVSVIVGWPNSLKECWIWYYCDQWVPRMTIFQVCYCPDLNLWSLLSIFLGCLSSFLLVGIFLLWPQSLPSMLFWLSSRLTYWVLSVPFVEFLVTSLCLFPEDIVHLLQHQSLLE